MLLARKMQRQPCVASAIQSGRRALLGALCAGSVLLLAAACSKQGAESLVASAQDYARKGDHSAAVIQLKNALQQAPEHGHARLLLGQELLETHDPAAAEKELRRALALKQPEVKVVPLLARSLFELREFDALVKQFSDRRFGNPEVDSRVLAYLGEAYLATGRPLEASRAFAAAVESTAAYSPALKGLIRLAISEARLEDAIKLCDAAIAAKQPGAEFRALKAEALVARGERAGAKALLESALQDDPKLLGARFALISLLLEESEFDRAGVQLEAARKSVAGDLRVVYFDALLALRRGELAKAREQVLQVLKRADHVPSLVLAGAIELQAGQPVVAEDYLRRALARAPAHGGARRLLVAALLRAGQPARALEALQPLVGGGVEAAAAMSLLAGETYLANGDLQRAAAYFEQAAKADGQGVAARMRLGQIALARGETEEGIRELEEAARADANQNQADIALVLSHLRRKDGARALQAAQALVKKQPNNPVSFQLLGGVQMLVKDRTGARASFEDSLKLAPNFLPAAFSLAELDLADKKPELARRRFVAMLERDPNNEQIILAKAEIEFRSGGSAKDVTALLEKAVAANPRSSNARLALVNHQLRRKDPRAALVAAQDAAVALPIEPRVVEALASAQEAAGEHAAAIESINRLASLRPAMAEPLLRLAALYAKEQDYEHAASALRRAQNIAPENRQIDRDLVAMLVAQGKPELALKAARDLQQRAPGASGGFALEGDLQLQQGKFAEAERAYAAALKIEPASGVLAGRLAGAMFAGGKSKEGESFASRWLADHPRDTAVRTMLADRALRTHDLKRAATHYQALLSVEPNSVIALNNLAWIGGETGDGKAVSYAERAAELAPNSAAVLDTLGTLLVKRGEAQRGLEYLGKARELAPKRLDLRMNFARGLIAAGRNEAARSELRSIVAAEGNAAEKRVAAQLLETL